MSKSVVVSIPSTPASSYPIFVGADLETRIIAWIEKNISASQLVLITDHTVKKLFAKLFSEKLKRKGFKVFFTAFPAGEHSKNAATKLQLEEFMLRNRCGRDTVCLAFGGGVVGDLVGFVAATYMRGVPFIQIPTTLLSMVDSSVGGKTGIDTPYGKNLIGAFWQPKAVFSDVAYLNALSQQHFICGVIEAVKMFLTSDRNSFRYAQKNMEKILSRDSAIVQEVVLKAVKIKAKVVELDEKESGMRMVLNFGHTIGHAIEHLSEYKMLHGIAVGLGILVEAKIAQLLGILDEKCYSAIAHILATFGIKTADLKRFPSAAILKATQLDKKVRKGVVNYVLLQEFGSVLMRQGKYAHPVEDQIVKAALEYLNR